MKIFLTGATGYIGSQLAKRLLLEGHELTIVIRPDSNLKVLHKLLPQIEVHIHDGSYASLFEALQASKPELVFHVASLFLAQHQPEDVPRLIDSNINFPAQLLESMNKLGIKRFINTGTSWQHYNNDAYNPVNLYAATKQAFESLLAFYIEAHSFKAITLKLFDTYGPGDNRQKLFSLLRNTLRTGEILRLSPGNQLLDLVYIDDVLEAFLLAIEQLSKVDKLDSYAVSSTQRISLRDLIKIYSETVGRNVPVEWGGQPYRNREVLFPWTNHKIMPGWVPIVSLREGIKRMETENQLHGLISN